MKNVQLLFLLVIIYSITSPAQKKEFILQQENNAIAENLAIWDLQLFFNLSSSAGLVHGAEFDGNYFYTLWWITGVVQKYNRTGNLLEQFTVDSFTGIRDLAFDGTYMYGGKLTNKIFKMDFINKNIIDTINSPVSVKHIAYDALHDAFWVGDDLTGIYLVDRSGATISIIPPLTSYQIGGSAWDNITPGGPYLWISSSYNGIISQLKISTGTPTGIYHDVSSELGSGSCGGLFTSADYLQGTFSLGGLHQSATNKIFMYEIAETSLCPVGPAMNPLPAHNSVITTNSYSQLMWTNPPEAVMNDVYFGTNPGSMSLIHSGSLVSFVTFPQPLEVNKTYYWKVVEKNDTCSGDSPLWQFSTANFTSWICDDFSTYNWTPIGPQGMTNWSTHTGNNAGGYQPELRFSWTPSFVGVSRLISPLTYIPAGMQVELYFRFFIDWYDNPSGVFSVAYTMDGGNTQTTIWSLSNPIGNVGPELANTYFPAPSDTFQLVIKYQGDTYNIDYWYIDDLCTLWWWPVELKSFTAVPNNNEVLLSWTTATETNNLGFEIERSTDETNFNTISFVKGEGSTTEETSYSYSDSEVKPVKYFYRLKQVDLDGAFEYSDIIEADLTIPLEFSLEQNFPNPFNPQTTIKYEIPEAGIVSLKIYDILGKEVANLLYENQEPGRYDYIFDGSNLASGIYLYTLKVNSYLSTKKMTLIK